MDEAFDDTSPCSQSSSTGPGETGTKSGLHTSCLASNDVVKCALTETETTNSEETSLGGSNCKTAPCSYTCSTDVSSTEDVHSNLDASFDPQQESTDEVFDRFIHHHDRTPAFAAYIHQGEDIPEEPDMDLSICADSQTVVSELTAPSRAYDLFRGRLYQTPAPPPDVPDEAINGIFSNPPRNSLTNIKEAESSVLSTAQTTLFQQEKAKPTEEMSDRSVNKDNSLEKKLEGGNSGKMNKSDKDGSNEKETKGSDGVGLAADLDIGDPMSPPPLRILPAIDHRSATPGAFGVGNVELHLDWGQERIVERGSGDDDVERNAGLVRAEPVQGIEDDLPRATPEQDVQKQMSLTKPWLIFLMMSLFVGAISIGSLCASGMCSGQPKEVFLASSAPTSYRSSLRKEFVLELEATFGAGYFAQSNPTLQDARTKALDWIVHEDPLQLEPDAENVLRRYILALFYFQTTKNHPWKNCNPPSGTQGTTCFYTYTHPHKEDEVYGIRWLSEASECQWMGVICSKDTIKMDLYELGLGKWHFIC